MRRRHRFSDSTQQWFGVEMHPPGSLDFLDDYETFCPGFVRDRKRSTAVASQCRMAVLHGPLNILRVVVHAANDDQILDPAG